MHTRSVLLAALGAGFVLGAAAPAMADPWGHHGHGYGRGHAHERWEHERWRRHHAPHGYRGGGYEYGGYGPRAYYAPPPAYYAPPPVYYGVPAFSLRIH